MFMYSILKFLFVQTTGTSESFSVIRPLMPSGYWAESSVSSTWTFLSSRGLGRHEYHSLTGETKVFGMPRVMGLSVSSTISLAGSGGQLLTPKAPPPMNCLNHVHREFRSLYAATWKPSHAPPLSMYR